MVNENVVKKSGNQPDEINQCSGTKIENGQLKENEKEKTADGKCLTRHTIDCGAGR